MKRRGIKLMLMAGAVGITGVATLLVRAGSDSGPVAETRNLSCRPGELIGAAHRDLIPGVEGESSPEVALGYYLEAEAFDVPVSGFKALSFASNGATLGYRNEAGNIVMQVNLVNDGLGWRVQGWQACASFVEAARS